MAIWDVLRNLNEEMTKFLGGAKADVTTAMHYYDTAIDTARVSVTNAAASSGNLIGNALSSAQKSFQAAESAAGNALFGTAKSVVGDAATKLVVGGIAIYCVAQFAKSPKGRRWLS